MSRFTAIVLAFALTLAIGGCSDGLQPEALVKGQDACALCRMPVSDVHFAAQITAPGELPLFFDDPGCLGEFVKGDQAKAGSLAFVADHRTGSWVRADRAIFTRMPTLSTPMNHHLVAHESARSRDSDPDIRNGQAVDPREIFGPKGPPMGGLE